MSKSPVFVYTEESVHASRLLQRYYAQQNGETISDTIEAHRAEKNRRSAEGHGDPNYFVGKLRSLKESLVAQRMIDRESERHAARLKRVKQITDAKNPQGQRDADPWARNMAARDAVNQLQRESPSLYRKVNQDEEREGAIADLTRVYPYLFSADAADAVRADVTRSATTPAAAPRFKTVAEKAVDDARSADMSQPSNLRALAGECVCPGLRSAPDIATLAGNIIALGVMKPADATRAAAAVMRSAPGDRIAVMAAHLEQHDAGALRAALVTARERTARNVAARTAAR